MENFQFDVIDLPNKKVEYISQGLQAFAQGIAGGMTAYAKNLNDKAKERQEKQNALLKQYNEIEIYYRDQANQAIVEFGKTGGDVDQFKNEIMGLANQAIDARFQNATNTSLSSSQRQDNLNVEQGFFNFKNSGLLLSAKEEAVKKENEETLSKKNLGEQVGYDVSFGPGDIKTEDGRELNQRVSMFLDLYNKGQADERTGFKHETVVENKNGIATKVLKLTDISTGQTYDINRNYQNTNSTIVDTPSFTLSQQLEESEVKIKGKYQDAFLLNKSIEEQKDNIPGYRTFVTRQYLNMSSIQENLKANIQGDMSGIVSQGTGAIVNYMHRQGYTDEEISKVLEMPTNKDKSTYLAKAQEVLQFSALDSEIPNRPATEEEISMYKKLGVKLTERDGKPYVYGLDESISAQREVEKTLTDLQRQKMTDQQLFDIAIKKTNEIWQAQQGGKQEVMLEFMKGVDPSLNATTSEDYLLRTGALVYEKNDTMEERGKKLKAAALEEDIPPIGIVKYSIGQSGNVRRKSAQALDNKESILRFVAQSYRKGGKNMEILIDQYINKDEEDYSSYIVEE